MKKDKKSKQFLKLPEYPGGNESFKKFIIDNLRYPPQALEKGIEGIVYLIYDVSDNGEVLNPFVSKGIGYGCDEEALRLVSLMRYGSVKNRGLRLKSRVKSRVEFKLPPASTKNVSIKYSVAEKKKEAEKTTKSYNYIISTK